MGKRSKAAASKYAEPDDGLLESDSEADEFEDYVESTRRPDEVGSDEEVDEEEEGDGVGVYEADDWDANADSDSGSESESDAPSDNDRQMRQLKKGLDDIPLDTLLRVQAKMKASAPGKDNADGMSARERKLAAAKARLAEMQRAKGKAVSVVDADAGPSRRRRDDDDSDSGSEAGGVEARHNKNAPVAMGTKKQVSRRRTVVDVPRAERRDPRFSSISAEKANADVHAKRYSFVPDLLRAELSDLQAQVVAAKKAEKACKLVEKPQFTAAREEVERQLSQVRTRLDRAEREAREREVLAAARHEENEKRKEGKGAWYLKKSEKRDLLLKARFDALEDKGGKRAVKKAVDKKRKKVAAKEKKSRPFMGTGFTEDASGGKRRRVA